MQRDTAIRINIYNNVINSETNPLIVDEFYCYGSYFDTISSQNNICYITPCGSIYINDSVGFYKNITLFHIEDRLKLVIFPKSVNNLHRLLVINNWGYVSDLTFKNVNIIDSLVQIDLGIVTRQLTKIPEVLKSPNLKEVTINCVGINEKMMLKIIDYLQTQQAIENVYLVQASGYDCEYSKTFKHHLNKLENKYNRRNKKLFIYIQ